MNRTVRCGTVTAVWVCALLSAVHVCRGADAGAGRAVGAPADWPQWRGPERNGLGTGGPVLASVWPAAGPVKLWESEAIPVDAEHGWSTPAVADGRVYLSLAMNLGGQWRDVFFCLDAASGKTLWKKDYPGAGRLMEGSSSTVCVTGNRLFGAGSDSMLYCLNAADGSVVWKTDGSRWWTWRSDGKRAGTHASFLVADGLAVIQGGNHDGTNTQGAVVALDAATGAPLWSQRKHGGQGSPVLWRKDGGAYVLTVARDGLSAFELRTGKPLWTVLPGCSSVTPVVAGDYAVFLSDAWPKRGLVCFRMSLEKAEKAWMVEGRHDAGSSAVIYRGHVYATASNRGESGGYSRAHALCVNLDNGAVAWEAKVPCGGYASPLIVDGKFFFRAPGQIVMAEATPVAYKELGRATMSLNTYASPIISGGRLFVRMGGGGWSKGAPGKIACYDLRK
jgi:outer membrane protein assembly factor BamB